MDSPAFTIWFTGLPCSGKTTLCRILKDSLHARNLRHVEVFDGDEVRRNLSAELGFSKKDRDTHILRLGYLCHLLNRNGVPAMAAVISPYREIRDEVRQKVERFVEVYVNCPVEVCAERDVKGMYEKAFKGEIQNFTGVSDPYEEPLDPEVVVETHKETPEACVGKILRKLEELGYIEPGDYEYTEEEARAIKAKLTDLGYID
ncbi:MAG: adenylyl-sulfate kinase [Nitrospinota bacterium]